eukprot:g23807.t1
MRLIADLKERNSWNVYKMVLLEQLVEDPTREQGILDLVMYNEADLIRELKVKERLGGSDHNIIEFTLQFEREKLESDVTVLQLTKDTSNIPELQESQGAEVSAVAITKETVLGKPKGLEVDKSPGPDGLHPRVLKEIAEEIVEVVNFQESL